jgi:peptide/nickel transport system permease protein
MTDATQAVQSWRVWLASETPSSRRQAVLGNAYRSLRKVLSNPAALTGLLIVLTLILIATFANLITGGVSPYAQTLANRLAAPSAAHWFGTDELGRDIFARIIYGARVTLTIVLLAFAAALGPGIENAVIAISLTAWPPYARMARAETITIARSDFISAVVLQGASTPRILLRHIVPLCLSSLIVRLTLDMAGIILTAAGLGFLGLGAQPPMSEWGAMVSSGRDVILDQWWVATIPGLAIFIVSLGFNLLGDGLRDVFDPKSS